MKKYSFFILFLITHTLLYSQSCEELNKNVSELYAQGKFKEAIKIANAALIQCKVQHGELDMEYTKSLGNLAALFSVLENYDRAEPLYLKTILLRKQILGDRNQYYAETLLGFGSFYRKFGYFEKSIQIYLQALKIFKITIGEEDAQFLTTLVKLTELYEEIGFYNEAEISYIRVLGIIKKTKGENSIAYSHFLDKLASLNENTGNYKNVEFYFLEARKILKTLFGESLEYVSYTAHIALELKGLARNEKSEELFLENLKLAKSLLGKTSELYLKRLNDIAGYYANLGILDKAEPYFLEAQSIAKKAVGVDKHYYGILLNNIGLFYLQKEEFKKAEEFFIESIKIQKEFGENSSTYATALNNFSFFYFSKNPKMADSLLHRVLKILKNISLDNSTQYAETLNNVGALNESQGYLKRALNFYEKSLRITINVSGTNSPYYYSIINNIGRVHFLKNELVTADSFYNISNINLIKELRYNFSFFSNYEANAFIKNLDDQPFSLISNYSAGSLVETLFNRNLFFKSVFLQKTILFNHASSNSYNDSVIIKLKSYKTIGHKINEQHQLPISKQSNIKELKDIFEILEKDLMKQLPEFKKTILNNNVTWQDVQLKLNTNEVALDFMNIRYFDKKRWTDTILYAAFVIRPDWEKPKFVSLFQEDELVKILGNENNAASINYMYNKPEEPNPNKNLYQLIIQPMDSFLTGVKKIYLSPSGLLNRVSFSAITLPEGGKMIDKYDVQTMSNIRMLAEHRAVDTTIRSVSLFGGIDYENEPSVTTSGKSFEYTTSDTSSSFSTLRNIRGGKWSALPGTTNEIGDIQNIATTLKIPVVIYTNQNASEESFKLLGDGKNPAPSIMHIATHGFAFSTPKEKPKEDRLMITDEKKPVFKQSEDPLTRAGLVMAGGNQIWTKGQPYPNREDGILTAREVSDLDLRGCVLATLSACETGLGDIKGSEGVFGLQRAFKMAGVQNLIVSLWRVLDKETAEFMQIFYTKWLKQKLPLKDAFRQTQLTMSKKYKPYQWAAFVLVN